MNWFPLPMVGQCLTYLDGILAVYEIYKATGQIGSHS